MANLAEILSKGQQKKKSVTFEIRMIDYKKLIPNRKNRKSIGDIPKLADEILLAGGIKQNLLVRKLEPEKYEIISGHRRYYAARHLVEDQGKEEYRLLPCRVETEEDLLADYDRITGNSTIESLSEYEKMQELEELKKIIPQLAGDEEIKGRVLRKLVAEAAKLSETTVAELGAISNNLSENLMEKFETGELSKSVAYHLSGLEKEEQEKLVESNPEVTVKEIREYKKTVSENDTAKKPQTPVNTIQRADSGEEIVEQESKTAETPVNTGITPSFMPDNLGPEEKREKRTIFDFLREGSRNEIAQWMEDSFHCPPDADCMVDDQMEEEVKKGRCRVCWHEFLRREKE